MKVDVAITFYRRYHYLPMLRWGLIRAAEHIDRVIIVNGERWPPTIWSYLTAFERLGLDSADESQAFTYSQMVNKGIRNSRSIYTLHIDDDVILKEDTIPKLLAHADPTRFMAGTCYNVPEFSNPEDLEERDDVHELVHRSNNVPQSIACGPLWLVHRETFLSMGGFDETLTEYADQDGEFILRWQTKFGTDKAVLTDATAYQIHTNRPSRPKPKGQRYYDLMTQRMNEWRAAQGGSYRLARRPEGMVFENVR